MFQNIKKTYRNAIRGKTRIVLAWVFFFLLLFFAKKQPSFGPMVLGFLGATLRFWASGYLKKDQVLTVGGPYRWTRNPLYLGTFFMGVGAVLSIQAWGAAVVFVILFLSIYFFIIEDEAQKLGRLFGKAYQKYCDRVPGFFPAFFPLSIEQIKVITEKGESHFSFSLAMKNKAYEAYIAFIALFGVLWGMSWVWNHLLLS